jgi:uncharacterized LabA/DUF88 family protein
VRTNIYVDGFNLYYGAVKDTRYKWLNIQRFFTMLRPDDEIRTIYYFTAEIRGSRRANQEAYLRALATLPKVSVVLGRYKLKTITCNVADCTFQGKKRFYVPEEKRTDINIALTMARDAWEDACDCFVLVSGDSDLVPAVAMVKEIAPAKRVIVYVPARDERRGAAVELRGAADKARVLPNLPIRRAQFPPEIPDGVGGVIRKPTGW